MKKSILLLLVIFMLMSMCMFVSAENDKTLSFGADGKFTVLQISHNAVKTETPEAFASGVSV